MNVIHRRARAGVEGTAMEESLIGYQGREHWMGSEYLTLRDVIPERPRAMIVGLNPSPVSVEAGHYYQGPVGQRQLHRLANAGLFHVEAGARVFEEAALAASIGFTDIVKRPTSRETGLMPGELTHGRDLLIQKLADLDVPLVVCVFRHPVEALLEIRKSSPGMQRARTSWGASVFRMPGPYDKTDTAAAVLSELTAHLRGSE